MGSRAMRKLTLRVALVFELVLVFLVATVALGVMGLGLARTTAVLALLDGATLRVDVVQFTICPTNVSPCFKARPRRFYDVAYRRGCSRSLGDP